VSLGTRVSSFAVALAAGLAVVLAGGTAVADPGDDRARVKRDLARARSALESASARVEAAAGSLVDARHRLPVVRRRLVDARAALTDARRSATDAARMADAATGDLTAADRALRRATRQVDQTRDEISRYAASAYQGRDIASMGALLSADSPADLVAGLTYMQQVAREQTRVLDANRAARAGAAYRRAVREQRAADAVRARQRAEATVLRALDAARDAAAAERQVVAVTAQRARALAVAEQEREATEARLRELRRESRRIAAHIRDRARGDRRGPVVRSGSPLSMPVNGWKSSDFGMRLDPVYGVYRLHAGVDLAAPGGAAIRATAAGDVLRAGWNGGYGNYTCVYHGRFQGRGFATCYAHQSAVLVRPGQHVRRGQVIGRVGTTGASTGNHLHFEVRLNGDPVNPVPWLPACLC
jgi:murein DD-endopeptidase MepM/ murein hydrolase activator NlpD